MLRKRGDSQHISRRVASSERLPNTIGTIADLSDSLEVDSQYW